MENISTSLKVRCVAAGVTLKEMAHAAGVSPVTLLNWRKNEPKTLRAYRKLMAAIEAAEKEKQAKDENAAAAPISE